MRRILFLLALSLPFNASAATTLTIYGNDQGGNGYAWVKEERAIDLKSNHTKLTLENLPKQVDSDSVKLSPKDGKSFTVSSQQFRFDLVNQGALFSRFLGQDVSVERVIGDSLREETGTLVSEAPLMIKKRDGTVLSFQQYDAVHFPKLPDGLALEPSLEASLASANGGKAQADLLYQTRGMGWWIDYTLKLTKENVARFESTLHATNNSGKDFTDASLAVVAGNVQPPQRNYVAKGMAMRAAPMAAMEMASDSGVAQVATGDVHRYDVPGSVNLPNNTTTELPFLGRVVELPVQKRYRYRGTSMVYGGGYYLDRNFGVEKRQEVEATLNFTNAKEAGLGIPLPDGKMRVFDDTTGRTTFLGETQLQRLSAEEKAEVPLGSAFDITGKREQEEYEMDQARKIIKETIRITLNNRSKNDVTIDVEENLYRSPNAQVIEKTHEFQRIDANSIRFPVAVKAGKEAVVRYTVKYTWQ